MNRETSADDLNKHDDSPKQESDRTRERPGKPTAAT